MERDPQGGSGLRTGSTARHGRRAARDAPRHGAGCPRPDRRLRAGQRPRARDRAAQLRHRDARARLDGRLGRHLPGPPSGRHPRPERQRDRRRGARSRGEPQPLPAPRRRGARATSPSSTPSMPARFDVIVNGDHLLSWGVGPEAHPGRGDEQPRDVVGRRGLDRRGLGRTAPPVVRHRRRLGRVADPPCRRSSTS